MLRRLVQSLSHGFVDALLRESLAGYHKPSLALPMWYLRVQGLRLVCNRCLAVLGEGCRKAL